MVEMDSNKIELLKLPRKRSIYNRVIEKNKFIQFKIAECRLKIAGQKRKY